MIFKNFIVVFSLVFSLSSYSEENSLKDIIYGCAFELGGATALAFEVPETCRKIEKLSALPEENPDLFAIKKIYEIQSNYFSKEPKDFLVDLDFLKKENFKILSESYYYNRYLFSVVGYFFSHHPVSNKRNSEYKNFIEYFDFVMDVYGGDEEWLGYHHVLISPAIIWSMHQGDYDRAVGYIKDAHKLMDSTSKEFFYVNTAVQGMLFDRAGFSTMRSKVIDVFGVYDWRSGVFINATRLEPVGYRPGISYGVSSPNVMWDSGFVKEWISKDILPKYLFAFSWFQSSAEDLMRKKRFQDSEYIFRYLFSVFQRSNSISQLNATGAMSGLVRSLIAQEKFSEARKVEKEILKIIKSRYPYMEADTDIRSGE